MTLGCKVNGCNFAKNLVEVENLLKSAQGKVSFMGERVITVYGYSGSFSLNEIAHKTIQASNYRRNANDLTFHERQAGQNIVNKLEELYKTTDNQLEGENWLTRLLNFIREFSLISYNEQFLIENGIAYRNFCN